MARLAVAMCSSEWGCSEMVPVRGREGERKMANVSKRRVWRLWYSESMRDKVGTGSKATGGGGAAAGGEWASVGVQWVAALLSEWPLRV